MWSTQQFAADIDGTRKEINITTSTPSLKRCTTATNTEELLRFSSTEVQTNPYELPESESESNDEPIENLSVSPLIFAVASFTPFTCTRDCVLYLLNNFFQIYPHTKLLTSIVVIKCPLVYISRY